MRKRRDVNVNQMELIPGPVAAVAEAPAAPRVVAAPMPVMMTPWVRVPQPNGEVLLRPGKPVVMEEEIGTREAAKILGLNQRTVERYCEVGVLVENVDWWQPPARPGSAKGGMIRIKRSAVMRLRGM